MGSEHRHVALAVDLGKTACRARVPLDGRSFEEEGPGAPGLADARGVETALQAIDHVVRRLPASALARVDRVGVGAAGADADPAATEKLAHTLSEDLDAPVVVVTDVLVAHLGAFSGGPGTVLVAGTGSVAYGLDGDGRLSRADGWGPLLGDEGSGRWIGQAGLQGALRAFDGRGPETSLAAAAADVAGSPDRLPTYVHGSREPGRTLAAFAPVVLAHAEAGDAVARSIVARAARLLAGTARAAAGPGETVCVVGGLTRNALLMSALTDALAAQGLTPKPPDADALAGACALAGRTDLPHERYAVRVAPTS